MKVRYRDRSCDIALVTALFALTAVLAQAQMRTPSTLEMPQSHNPLSPYMADHVGQPVLTNSPRLDRMIRDG